MSAIAETGVFPPGMVIEDIHQNGYAASASRITALQGTIPGPCRGIAADLQGCLIPNLTGAADGLSKAAEIARAKSRETLRPEFGYLFRVKVHARIAKPSTDLAKKMTSGEGIDIWQALRPFAEEGAFHGVQFSQGLLIFRAAQDDACIKEEYFWKVRSSGLTEESD